MVKRIQCFLSDSEAYEMEKAKEKLDVTSDYAFVKMAISEFCNKINASKSSMQPSHNAEVPLLRKRENHPRQDEGYVKIIEALASARYMCAKCSLPLIDVEGLKSCPRCGHTKYKEIKKEG